jgi:S-adenosylmethionine:tRNA-ribosyltransferase-isomerase (queuine synthetase)
MHFTKDGIMINSGNTPIKDILEQYGQLPLPPYITDHTSKQQRYQTRRAEHE